MKEHIKTKPRIYDFLNAISSIKSPAQIWLDEFSKSNNHRVDFIQVGANDGLRWDPVRRFILRDDWRGVLVEPLYPVYKMLIENYAYKKRGGLFFENCVVSDQNDEHIDFWSYSNEFLDPLPIEKKLYYLRASSLYRDHVKNFLDKSDNMDNAVVSYKTRCMTLRVLIDKYFPSQQLDLVFVDAEGHDDYVIRTIDFDRCKPKAIFYESHNLGTRSEELADYLSQKGYDITNLVGDTVATAK